MEQSKRSTEEVLEGIYSKSGYLQELWNNLPREGKDLVIDSKNLFEKYLSQRLGVDVEYRESFCSDCMIEAFNDMMKEVYPRLSFIKVQYVPNVGWSLIFRPFEVIPSKYREMFSSQVLSKKLFNKAILLLASSVYDLDYFIDDCIGIYDDII